MAELFTLKPGLPRSDLIDELNGRLSAGLEAIIAGHDTHLDQSQWAGIYALQQCAQIAEALGRGCSDDLATSNTGDGTDTADGAQAVVSLLRTIKGMSDDTAGRPGGRDYAAMADAIDAALLDGTCGSSARRRGFVLALADLFCINADGGGVAAATWEPLTAIAREGQRAQRQVSHPPALRAVGTGAAAPASEPTSPPVPLPHTPPAANIPGHLAALGREATYEIAALTQALVEQYGQLRDEDQRPLVVRGLALRVHELNSQVMSILDVPEEYVAGTEAHRMRRTIVGEAAASTVSTS